ncbi:MAG: hypothetical protein WAL47_08730 [Pyrinomonadaceae bacterium]
MPKFEMEALAVNRTFPLLLTAALLLTISTATLAQNPQSIVTIAPVTSASGNSAPQDIRTALASLPEADTLVFINPRRIINEVAPRVMSEKDLEAMRKTFADINQFAGVDPTKVDFIVMAVRFRKPTADLKFVPPEFMAVTSGDFNSESLMNLARVASEGKFRDETYGSKTLSLMTIDPIAKESEKNPFLKSFAEVGVVALTDNSIAVGTPNYLRAAIDAAGGNGRISMGNLNSLLRDPSVLASAAGSPMGSFSRSFGIFGTETNPRAPKCESNLGDFYVALTMDATNFMLRGAMGADNPDTASIMNSLLSGFLRQAGSFMPGKAEQSVLNSLQLTAKDNEVVLSADLPQQMVIDFIKSHSQPKKEEAKASTPTPAKKPVVRRKRRRPSQ